MTEEKAKHVLDILVVSSKYNPNYVTKRDDYLLVFTDKNNITEKISEGNKKYEIIIIDGTVPSELPGIITTLRSQESASIFICGEIGSKEELYGINNKLFFWDDKFENISLEKAIELTKLKSSNIGYRDENKSLKEKLELQKIMLTELEATNNHLISATWREREMKKKLTDTISELNKTKQIVETQNKRIEESINYARKIQLAINPTETDLQKSFSESFILYLPKDIISGDFPWIFNTEKFCYVASVDCTGHGVPGAMMSMIGNLLLNDIINNGEDLPPSEVLLQLHKAVVNTLKQGISENNSNDGMDIGLCRIDKKAKRIDFSGAHRPLFLLRDGAVVSFSGDKFPIGGVQYKGRNKYTDHTISYNEGDRIFLFTDGFPDQIGGPEKRKLMVANLKIFLEQANHVPMEDLKPKLTGFYMEWKADNKQIDDVLIIGIKL